MQLVFQFPQTYFATKMNSETLEILFSFLAISMATFLAQSHSTIRPLHTSFNLSTTITSPQQATAMVKCYTSVTLIQQRVKGLANYVQAKVKSFWS